MNRAKSRDVLLSTTTSPQDNNPMTPLPSVKIKKFIQQTATMDELINHCRSEHPKTCRDLEKMGPTQVAEMKQRLKASERLGFAGVQARAGTERA